MKIDPLIRANRLARRGNYEAAIKILEAEENRYYSSFTYYYLFGLCYLNSRVYGNALTHFRKARELRQKEPLGLLGLAVLYLNHGDTDRAVDTYLDVLELDEKNKIAAKALKVIRKHPGPENISSWIDSGRLHTLFPPMPKMPASGKAPLVAAVAVIAALGIGIGAAAVTGVLPFAGKDARKTPAEAELLREDLAAPMQLEGSFRYVLTRDEVNNHYNEARRLFTSFHDEGARVSLNRILESNGPEPVKNKARLLLSYLETPGFDSLKDRFSYAEVIAEPVLYRDCHIIWRGMATNIDAQQSRTSLDFMVGYDPNTRRTLEGIVRVEFDFAIAVNPERPAEILGQVVPVNTEQGLSIRIRGLAINQAGLLEQQTQ